MGTKARRNYGNFINRCHYRKTDAHERKIKGINGNKGLIDAFTNVFSQSNSTNDGIKDFFLASAKSQKKQRKPEYFKSFFFVFAFANIHPRKHNYFCLVIEKNL